MKDVDPAAPRLGAWRLGLAAAAYALLAVVYTWPAVTELRTHLLAGPWDGPMFLWHFWWEPHALFDLHHDPLTSDHVFAPLGTSLVVDTHALLPSLASWPLQKLFGLVPAFDLAVLLTFVLAGLGGFLLTNEVVADARASFLAGAVYAFGHLRVSKIVFFNLIQNWTLAFFAFALWRALRLRSWRWSVAAGVIGAAIFWTDYDLALFAALWGIAFAVFALVDAKRFGVSRLGLLGRWSAMALVLLALASPLAWRLKNEWTPDPGVKNLDQMDASLEAPPLWRFYQWGPFDGPTPHHHFATGRQAAFLGYATMALVAFGLWTRRKERSTKFAAAVAAIFLLLALGPELNLGDGIYPDPDSTTQVPLPFRWVAKVPVLSEVRIAHRFGVLAWLALALAAGIGARELLRWIEARFAARPRLAAGLATALACAGVMVDFTRLPFAVRTKLPASAPALEEIAADPRDCSVVEWPSGRLGDPFFGYYRALHGKPAYLDGQLARTSKPLLDAQRKSEIRRAMRFAFFDTEGDEPPRGRSGPSITTAATRREKVGWIVLSQFDVDLLIAKRKPWSSDRLQELDARVRKAFPFAKRTWLASDDQVDAFVDPAPGKKRWAKGTLFAVYRLP